MTKREEERRRRLLRRWKVAECTCEPEKPKDTKLDVLLKFASLSAIVVGFISSLLHYSFAINAEKFYGVSSLYFYKDRIFDFGATVLFIFIPAFIWLIPVFVKKVSKESEFNLFDRLLFSFAVALLVLLESLFFSDHFFENVILSLFLSIFLCIISFIGYNLLFLVIARNNAKDTEEKNKTASLLFNKGKAITIISGRSYVLIAVTVFLMAFLLIIKLSPLNVKNQRGYEFISGKESGYRIVVGHYQDSVILMRGSTSVEPKKGSTSVEPKRQSTKECPEKESQLTIIKGDYRIEPLGERQIEYRQFDEICVESKVKPKDEG